MIPINPKYYVHIAIAVLLALSIGLGVSKFNDYIEDKVEVQYTEKIDNYQKSLEDKISNLEKGIKDLSDARALQVEQTDARLQEILVASKSKKFVTVTKEGKCTLSQDFLDSYNSIVSEGNKK